MTDQLTTHAMERP